MPTAGDAEVASPEGHVVVTLRSQSLAFTVSVPTAVSALADRVRESAAESTLYADAKHVETLAAAYYQAISVVAKAQDTVESAEVHSQSALVSCQCP